MSFNKNKEFQRQLDFQKERILEAITQHINIFERHELHGELDTPILWESNDGYNDVTVDAITKEGAELYQCGNKIHTQDLKELDNQQLITILKAMEETQEAFLTEQGII